MLEEKNNELKMHEYAITQAKTELNLAQQDTTNTKTTLTDQLKVK